MSPDLAKKAISANIEAMRQHLTDCVVKTSEAFQAIQKGEQNQAIGAMLNLDQDLEYALALYRAALALHRAGRAP
jgi:hypothetical protein